MPLQRRLPKRGFNNTAFEVRLAVVNVQDLAVFPAGTVVDMATLKATRLVRGSWDGVKVLGDGEIGHALTVRATRFSASAREKIVGAGGQVIRVDAANREIAEPEASAE